MMSRFGSLVFLSVAGQFVLTHSFAPNPVSPFRGIQYSLPQGSASLSSAPRPSTQKSRHSGTTTSLTAKLWDRLQIEEDEEPMWYLLNCVATLEIDLLRQCREICSDMPDAIKFVVPTEIKTRSHGANKMVTETKVTYPGYVFAKIRLCPEVYETIQELDLTRSWMGTVNHKGYKKLPPAPQALNEIEVENFGLEEVESTEEEEDDGSGVILDTAEEEARKEARKTKLSEEGLKVFLGLRVDDMVKVTAAGKFFDEDGIVRRLKDGKIFVRFYTYGSMFEEWLGPGDMRKLSDEEVLAGLGGASKPVTQEDFDGPKEERAESSGNGWSDTRRGGLTGSDPRNRRQDRVDDGRAKRAGSSAGRDPSGAENGARRNRAGNDEWAQGDVDSQWGRKPQRPQQGDARPQRPQQGDARPQRPQQGDPRPQRNMQDNRRNEAAMKGSGDWSSFVSPATSAGQDNSKKSDDFFDTLMTDLSKDLGNQNGGPSQSPQTEDDFFASLMSELSDETAPAPSPPRRERAPAPAMSRPKREESSPGSGSDASDDFFASLEAELGSAMDDPVTNSKGGRSSDEPARSPPRRERAPAMSSSRPKREESSPGNGGDASDDFFAALEAELGSAFDDPVAKSRSSDNSDDFFAKLEAELAPLTSKKTTATASSVLEKKTSAPEPAPVAVMEESAPAPKKARGGSPKPESSNGSSAPSDLGKCTVPALKDMLRERGLKVSGNKADLIQRLS